MREPTCPDTCAIVAFIASVILIQWGGWHPQNWLDGIVQLGMAVGISWVTHKVQSAQMETYWKWRDEEERMK